MPNVSLSQAQLDSIISAINSRSKSNLFFEYVVTGSAVTSINIPNLDIITHKDYRIELDLKNATATASTIKMYSNADVTPANYASQTLYSTGTAVPTSLATADAVIGVIDISSRCLINSNLSLSVDGYFRWSSLCSRGTMTLPTLSQNSGLKKAIIANLTSLTITASVASSIAVGSVVRIFRGDQ